MRDVVELNGGRRGKSCSSFVPPMGDELTRKEQQEERRKKVYVLFLSFFLSYTRVFNAY